MTKLTDDERDELATWNDGTYTCGTEQDCVGYSDSRPGHDHEDLFDVVARIIATRAGGAA